MTHLIQHPILASGIEYAWTSATSAGLAICSLLFLLSIFSWSVMLSKLFVLRKIRKQSDHFLEMFRGQQNPLELFEMGNRFPFAPAAHVYRHACKDLSYYLLREGDDGRRRSKVTPTQLEAINATMDRAVGEAVVRLEEKTTILATAVSGAPFLGLLGTVWGVMDTFSSVAQASGAASLQSIAPGVSSALVTTVVGLLVAIPAMFGYNLIVNRIRVMVARLDNFAAELQALFSRHFLGHGCIEVAEETPTKTDSPRMATVHDDAEDGQEDEESYGMQPERSRDNLHSRPPSPDPGPLEHSLGRRPI